MIIFKTFQGLENFYIKFRDHHTFPGSVRTLINHRQDPHYAQWNTTPSHDMILTNLENTSKHFYFTILPLAAQPTSLAAKRLWIFGLDGAI